MGNHKMCFAGVSADHSYPLFDSYKLFMFSVYNYVDRGLSTPEDLELQYGPIFNYFYDQEFDIWPTAIDQRDNFFSIPRDGALSNVDHMPLIKIIIDNYSNDLNGYPSDYVMDCEEGECISTNQIEKEVF